MKSISCLISVFFLSGAFFALPLAGASAVSAAPDVTEVDQARYEQGNAYLGANPYSVDDQEVAIPVFGSQLFNGDFGDLSFSGFNPNYLLGVGDEVQIMMWGAVDSELELKVDAKGNIFIPKVGPVSVLGVRNENLNSVIGGAIQSVFTDNIESYANLLSTQTVRVFVSGFVQKPGLYEGFSSDSALYFLDRAGGVDPRRGSYINIDVIRNGEKKESINLYEFLNSGTLPPTNFRDGDVILVNAQANSVLVGGRASNPGRFEFAGSSASLPQILELASPLPDVTAASIRRVKEGEAVGIVVPMGAIAGQAVLPGDVISLGGRNQTTKLIISFSGEHDGVEHAVFPKGATLADAIEQIEPSMMSNMDALQLYRASVAKRQKDLLMQSLDNLERNILNASSVSLEEAQLRQTEAQSVLSFIERARQVSPRGQVLLESLDRAETIYLEDRDIIHVPALSELVTIHGEVKYPNTQTHRAGESLEAYIERAGGFTDNANEKEIILIKPNGSIKTVKRLRSASINSGDELIVLPEADSKRLLFAKEISTILYQIALSARVAIGL